MRRGVKGKEFALKELSIDKMGSNLIKHVDECFEKWNPKPNFTVFDSDIKFDNYQRYPLKLKEETIKKVKELV